MKPIIKSVTDAFKATWKQLIAAIIIAIASVWVINDLSWQLSGKVGAILFYGIYLMLLVYTLAFNKILFKQFIKPSRYMFSLYIAVSFSFVIISIIFGFHTDLLVKYDNAIRESHYHWINPINVLQFPLEQTSKNKKQPIDKINLRLDFSDNTINIFIIDNTASVQNDSFTNRYTSGIIKNRNLKPVNSSSIENSNQLIAPLLLNELFYNDLTENNDAIFYKYDGRTNSALHSLIDINTVSMIGKKNYNQNKISIHLALVDSLKSLKGKDATTDLNEFFNIAEIVKHPEVSRYKSVKIYFISDYQDEKGIKHFYPNLDTLLAVPNIETICFVRTKGLPNRQDAFEKVIAQGRAFNEGDDVTINYLDFLNNNSSELNSQLGKMCSSNTQSNNVDSSIVFSYPYMSRSGKLNLTSQVSTNAHDEYLTFCLKNLDNPDDAALFSFEISGKPHFPAPRINEQFIINEKVKEGDIIKMTFSNYNVYENSRLRFDIYSKRFNSVTSRWCEVLPVVPINSVNLLVIFYAVLIFSLSLMFIYAQFLVIYLINKSAIKTRGTLGSSSIIPTIGLSFYMIPMFYVLYWYGKEYPLCIGMVLLTVLLITITHYLLFVQTQLQRWINTEYNLIMIF